MTKYKHIPTKEIFTKDALAAEYKNDRGWRFPMWLIEHIDSKDWEKVEEKKYELLRWSTDKTTNSISHIESILRLSDNERFTVGQEIIARGEPKHRFAITGFKIVDDGGILIQMDGGFWPLDYISPAPKREPLFVSADGKELFKDDYVYTVREGFKISEDQLCDAFNEVPHTYSTREAAEDYVIDHKKEFSSKEVWEMFDLTPAQIREIARERCGFKKEESK